MPQNLNELGQMLSSIKPWVKVAVVLGILLVGYYFFQGWRYWQAASEISSLDQAIQKSDSNIARWDRIIKSTAEELERGEAKRQRPVEELRGLFSPKPVENLMAIVAASASNASVDVTTMNPGSPRTEVLGEWQYQVQTLSITLRGATVDLYRFLSLLQTDIPVVSASDVRISGARGSRLAQMDLLFYLAPEPAPKGEAAGS